MNMPLPEVEGLRFRNKDKDEIRIYVTVQAGENREIKFVISDVTVRRYRTRTHVSLNQQIRSSYLYKCLETCRMRQEYLAEEYAKYVSKEQIALALFNAWQGCKPNIDVERIKRD